MKLAGTDSSPLVNTYDKAQDIIQLLQAPGLDTIGIDYETDGLNIKTAKIHGMSLATKTQAWYFTGGAEFIMYPLLQDMAKKGILFVGHNLAFDLHFMWRAGIRPTKIADTMMAQFLVNENQELGLKSLAHTKFGIEELPDFKSLLKDVKKEKKLKRIDQVKIDDIPLNKLAIYAARDAQLTLELWAMSRYDLANEGMTEHFWNIEMPFIYVLTDMEETGLHINQKLLAELESEFTQLRDDALATFDKISGGINPASPKQLVEFFYNKLHVTPTVFTKTGSPSVDALALSRIQHEDPTGAAKALATYRQYSKLMSTYITSFREEMVDGYLYGHFNQLGDAINETGSLPRTGRLSSSHPNLMNIPARGEIGGRVRELFNAPDNHSVLDIDYSQLEMRILAHYTKDQNLLNVFETNGDPHQLTADLCNVPRHIAKSLNFGVAYGAGPRKFADVVERTGKTRPSEKEAKEYLNKFNDAYPTIANWKKRVVDYARSLGYVKTIAGRKRRLPELNDPDRGLRATAERQAVNTIIQASAADIIKWAMIQVYPEQKHLGAQLMAQVHDELVFYVPNDVVEKFAPIAQRYMEDAGRHYNLRVKLDATPGIGDNWHSAKA